MFIDGYLERETIPWQTKSNIKTLSIDRVLNEEHFYQKGI